MSFDVLAVAVDLERVNAAIGSNDLQLVAQIAEEFADDLAQTEDLQEELLDEGQGPYLAAEALRDLIAGGPYRPDAGLSYYFCFEILCRHFGDTLDNDLWTDFKPKWLVAVQDGLVQAGVPEDSLTVARLMFCGPTVDVPYPEDYPNLGYFTKDEVATAYAALAKADLARVEDGEVRAAIEQLRSWLEECAESGRDLVCAYA